MSSIETAIDIQATPEKVWKILIDFNAFPAWNPFIPHLAGSLEPGSRLEVCVKPPGGRGITLHPRLLRADGRELRWLGRLFIPRLFDGEHSFTIEPLDGGGVRFHHRETFRGLLVLLLGGLLKNTRRGFEEMNLALKQRAEA